MKDVEKKVLFEKSLLKKDSLINDLIKNNLEVFKDFHYERLKKKEYKEELIDLKNNSSKIKRFGISVSIGPSFSSDLKFGSSINIGLSYSFFRF